MMSIIQSVVAHNCHPTHRKMGQENPKFTESHSYTVSSDQPRQHSEILIQNFFLFLQKGTFSMEDRASTHSFGGYTHPLIHLIHILKLLYLVLLNYWMYHLLSPAVASLVFLICGTTPQVYLFLSHKSQ